MAGLRHTSGPTIQQLAAKVKGIGGPIFRQDLGAAMGAAALKELYAGFRQSRDPYGNPWAPVDRTTKRGKPGKPLMRTGHLRASASMEVVPAGFRIALAAEYARFHQYGTKGRRVDVGRARRTLRRLRGVRGGIRPRPMVPTRTQGGLGMWEPPITRAAKRVIREWSKL